MLHLHETIYIHMLSLNQCEMCVWFSVPDDRSSPASSENSDSGLFLLKKDSERRAILYKVLNEDQDKVTSNLMENHIQVGIPAYLTVCVCVCIWYVWIIQWRLCSCLLGSGGAEVVSGAHQTDHLHFTGLYTMPWATRHGNDHLETQTGPGLRQHINQPDPAGSVWFPRLCEWSAV